MAEVRLPTVQWAQRSETLYLTIDLQEAQDPKIELSNGEEGGNVSFSGSAQSHAAGSEGHQYALELELYGKLKKEDSKIAVGARSIVLVIAKEESGFWPRLTHATGKARNIKIDWNKWVDEDEEEEKGDFDMSGLQNMQNYDMGGGGGGGMEGMMGGMGGGGMGGGGPGGGGMPDMAEMMKKMGGGAGGGGADMAKMEEMLKGMGAGGAGAGGGATPGGTAAMGDEDSDDDVPPLETA